MDQHPIPQDVTGFQFKLIGTMTVKQFGYVASGVIMAVILYYLPLHSPLAVLAKVMLVPFFGASGVIIAFVPLEGRPIDVMATNFVKALFSPNQYIYHRQGKKLSFSTVSVVKTPTAKNPHQKGSNNLPATAAEHHNEKEEKLRALLLTTHSQTKSDIDKKEAAFLNTLALPVMQPVQPPTQPNQTTAHQAKPVTQPEKPAMIISDLKVATHAVPIPIPTLMKAVKPLIQSIPTNNTPPTPNNNMITYNDKKEEPVIAKQPVNQPQIPANPPSHGNPEHKVTVLSQQINEIHAQKQQLEQELSHLKTQLATQKAAPSPAVPQIQQQPVHPMQTAQQVIPAQPSQPIQDPIHVHTIPQDVTKKVGLPHVSDSPNVVVGIVKDPRGNILPNILVEVKDKDGNPVRAFKTNQLGQFASATPLSPGTYTIELDDPKKQQRFDVIQIVANNKVLLPIEIISHDAREELRKQLFAN